MTTNVTSQGQAPDVDFVALQPGQAIGRYEIVAILGQGGFGITYRARDAQLNREVAIKEYLPSALAVRLDGVTVLPRTTKLADDFTWGRERFVEERHPLLGLVCVYEAGAEVSQCDEFEIIVTAASTEFERRVEMHVLLRAVVFEHARVECHPARFCRIGVVAEQ